MGSKEFGSRVVDFGNNILMENRGRVCELTVWGF